MLSRRAPSKSISSYGMTCLLKSVLGNSRAQRLIEAWICPPITNACPRLKRDARKTEYNDQAGYDAMIHELTSVSMLVRLAHMEASQVC